MDILQDKLYVGVFMIAFIIVTMFMVALIIDNTYDVLIIVTIPIILRLL